MGGVREGRAGVRGPGAGLLDRHKHKTMATLRGDGSPRISGAEIQFAGDDVFTGSMPDAVKGRDLRRDPRVRISGAEHPDTLTTRHQVARWTGAVGDAAGALRQYQQLLTDQTRILGAEHPHTLTTRNQVARWTGEVGGTD